MIASTISLSNDGFYLHLREKIDRVFGTAGIFCVNPSARAVTHDVTDHKTVEPQLSRIPFKSSSFSGLMMISKFFRILPPLTVFGFLFISYTADAWGEQLRIEKCIDT